MVDAKPPLYITSTVPKSEPFDIEQLPSSLPTAFDLASPDLNGPKLPEESEPSAHLVDQMDETWGLVSACSLVEQPHGLEILTAVANGYLIKGCKTLIGVRVVHAEKIGDFKELLKMYHGLMVLSEARAIRENLPWHLAVSRRAHNGLSRLT